VTEGGGGHRARKRFGQNFLHDQNVIGRIVDVMEPGPDDHFVEIGPGQGAMTQPLSARCRKLDVVEIDRDLADRLETQAWMSDVDLHRADALAFDFTTISNEPRSLRLAGNLPYNISTPLIFRLLENASLIEDMHFMLQYEVVQRLAAGPGSKNWGRLGIMAQFHCRVEALFEVPPEAFTPQPKVKSAIVRLAPHKGAGQQNCNKRKLGQVVQAAFAQRRKTLRNNLKGLIDSAALEALGIDPGARAETLTLEQFVEITNAVNV